VGRIVVGVDGSAGGAAALRWATDQAALHGHELVPVMAYTAAPATVAVPPSFTGTAPADEVERYQWDALERIIRPLRRGHVRLRPHVVEGSAADVILDLAVATDLVVVGSRGLGGFTGLLLGSVSREIVNRAEVPVAVVPGQTDAAERRGRVVVGVDGSDHAAAALRWAATEARARDAELEVVHTIAPAPAIGPPGTLIPPRTEEEMAEHAGRLCDDVVTQVLGTDPGLRATTRGMVGHPAHLLLEAAERADLLVVGGRGRGRLSAALLGSTSNACVTHAAVPTVVVRARPEEP
jgi:nucleotide-binding universal stress UspA family protein